MYQSGARPQVIDFIKSNDAGWEMKKQWNKIETDDV